MKHPKNSCHKDPTFEAVLSRLERQKHFKPGKSVFICSPYSGKTKENIERAKKYCRFAISKGYSPFAPHLFYPIFLNEETERKTGIFCGKTWLLKASEIWVFGDELTEGMIEEIKLAKKLDKIIRCFGEDVEEFKNGN